MLADARVVYLFLYVSDLDASRKFYRDGLGLRVIEEDPGCVKFDCGHVILALNRAADFQIAMPEDKDRSTEIVFLVDSMADAREWLESHGVELLRTSDEEPGKIANFYDPDGHWFSLYEPSEEALTWPSGERLRALMNGRQNGKARRAAPDPGADSGGGRKGLDGSQLVYAFFFVRDAAETQVFYHDHLGLRDIEGGPCSQTSHADVEGVVKYDTGGVLISTHLRPSFNGDDGHLRSVASVFYVKNVEHVVNALGRRLEGFSPQISRSGIGVVASFQDPSGHRLYLYEPSAEALGTPSGQKIQEIMAATL